MPKPHTSAAPPVAGIPVKYFFEDSSAARSIDGGQDDGLALYEARLGLQHLSLLGGYDELLCLDQLRIDRYWYQIETVKKVLKYFRGRVLLADEVGLGKTIEAGLIMQELTARQRGTRVLVIVPASLQDRASQPLYSPR